MGNEGQIGVILTPQRYADLINKEHQLSSISNVKSAQQDVEKNLNEVPQQQVGTPKIFEYEGSKYHVLDEGNIKVRGIFEKLFVHPKLSPFLSQVPKETLDELGTRWLPVVIYKPVLSSATENTICVRMADEFNAKFKEVK